MKDDKLYVDLYIALQRFINLCNLEDFKKVESYQRFSEMVHELNDDIYLLEILDKTDERVNE